ncbi:MAG: homoserine dehydrogenase [Alphaproteobacteria bacterium]|nr:homoserine dehydrogenase [Alphaproteobacteria bacterium]
MKEVKIALVGFGIVGHGVLEVIRKRQGLLREKGLDLKIISVTDHTGTIYDENGVDIEQVQKARILKADGVANSDMKGQEAIQEIESDLLVEVTPTNIDHGQPGLNHIETALSQGKHVVTSNKGPLVVAYNRLKELAEDNGVMLKYEATAGGTMPLINLVKHNLAGNEILGLRGIFNGTCNYILTRMMEESYPYSYALTEAQDLGIAESDPTYDVEGIDTAAKVVILANSIFDMGVKYKDVDVTGISEITTEALNLAKDSGYLIKLIGDVPALTVKPMLVPRRSPLAVGGTLNVASIETDLSGTVTVTGLGAGSIETASAVLSDIISIYTSKSIND